MESKPLEREKVNSEDTEQIVFVTRVRFIYPHLADCVMAIPNGGRRNAKLAALLKRAGVLRGAPDLLIAIVTPTHPGLFIEMKRRTGGKVSTDQQKIHRALLAQGYRVEVAEGAEQAWAVFENYIGATQHGQGTHQTRNSEGSTGTHQGQIPDAKHSRHGMGTAEG